VIHTGRRGRDPSETRREPQDVPRDHEPEHDVRPHERRGELGRDRLGIRQSPSRAASRDLLPRHPILRGPALPALAGTPPGAELVAMRGVQRDDGEPRHADRGSLSSMIRFRYRVRPTLRASWVSAAAPSTRPKCTSPRRGEYVCCRPSPYSTTRSPPSITTITWSRRCVCMGMASPGSSMKSQTFTRSFSNSSAVPMVGEPVRVAISLLSLPALEAGPGGELV